MSSFVLFSILRNLFYLIFVRLWQDENIDHFIMVYFCLVRMLGYNKKPPPSAIARRREAVHLRAILLHIRALHNT